MLYNGELRLSATKLCDLKVMLLPYGPAHITRFLETAVGGPLLKTHSMTSLLIDESLFILFVPFDFQKSQHTINNTVFLGMSCPETTEISTGCV